MGRDGFGLGVRQSPIGALHWLAPGNDITYDTSELPVGMGRLEHIVPTPHGARLTIPTVARLARCVEAADEVHGRVATAIVTSSHALM
jgi:hypothetical protein